MSKKVLSICLSVLLILSVAVMFCGCGKTDEETTTRSVEEFVSDMDVGINPSPDKYTWYIKNYVGKNCASLGYSSMSGKRMDEYGAGLVELVFVSEDGSYVDVESEDVLKQYSVVGQNIAPNTELKLIFEKDSEGNEYDSLVASQSYEEIVLQVKKIGSAGQDSAELTVIKPSPDKYTRYIADYVGRNLASCGYVSMGGDLMDQYGAAVIELIIVSDDGTFVDPEDENILRNYVVIGQNTAPNTELKLVFDKNSEGIEYDNLVESQNIEEIELYVKQISSDTQNGLNVKEKTTESTTVKATAALVDGMRPDFKAAMDSYEAFMNEYVDFMKKYNNNPSDAELLSDYADYVSKYTDFVEDFDKWEDEEMNNTEAAYYIDVQARVSKKLLEIS